MDAQISITVTVGVSLTFGAGGCYAMAKLMQLMERRRHDKAIHESESAEVFRPKARNPLFPNGEHDEIVAQINALRIQNLMRRKENGEAKSAALANQESLEELKISISDLSARLGRAGI